MGKTVDIFTRTQMTQMFTEAKVPTMWLMTKFFSNPNSVTEITASAKVAIDKVNQERYKAGYTKKGQEARVVNRDGFDTSLYEPPFINEAIRYDHENDSVRLAGDVPFGDAATREDQAAMELLRNAEELKKRWMREIEYQASSLMMTGSITTNAGDTFDFGLAENHTVDTDVWDGESADILGDLNSAVDLNAKDSGIPSNVIIMGANAWEAAIADTEFLAHLDNRRFSGGQMVDPTYDQVNRVSWKGTLNLTGSQCDVYVYNQWYYNGTENVKYIDDDKVWVGSDTARFDKYFAGIFDADAMGTLRGQYFVDQIIEKNPDGLFTRLRSCPLLAPIDINSYSVLTVLT